MMITHTLFLLQTNAFVQVRLEYFMLGLTSSQRMHLENLNALVPHLRGKSYHDSIADYLSKLRDAIYSVLQSSFDMEEIHIRWWFAIPPDWGSTAQTSLRGPALVAGFIRGGHDDTISFVAEPVAYVLHCCKILLFNPQPSDALLVVVAGKVTLALEVYEAINGHPLALRALPVPSDDELCG